MPKKPSQKVSCIIPAYNEGKNIEEVLKAVLLHPLIMEIIVVNDGSTDNTSTIVKKFKKVKLIELPNNHGKAYAMLTGAKASKCSTIVFIDADLTNLTNKNITELIRPVLDGKVDVTISFRNFGFPLKIYHFFFGMDAYSGERCLKKEIFLNLKLDMDTRFGIEALMNEYILNNNLKFAVIDFKNIKSCPKASKVGLIKGTLNNIKMSKEIFFNKIPPLKALSQVFRMSRRKVLYNELYLN
ncbi:MAG: glycosyltransferase family 2 protein [Nanoarchaeota archaeon]|nr:glycosyltransferase family 2 protein [Nanoarchaeota archaeon]